MSSLFSLENPVFTNFAFYSSVVLSKTLVMSEMLVWTRTSRKVFANEEDIKAFASDKQHEPPASDPTVERLRRCHLNDLENVIPFVLVGLLYVSTKPGITEATRVFQIFTVSRLLHSVAYLVPIPQPTRFLAFAGGSVATFFMAYRVFKACW